MAELPSTSGSKLATQWWQGLALVLLATLFLSMQNILVKIAQSPKLIPLLGGLLQLGGYVTPDTNNPFQVPLLVLLVRISFVVPILWIILPFLKSGAWQEARQVITSSDQMLKLRIALAGLFLFLSQTCIYLAISKIGPATAVTIFFIYPTVTTLLAWRLFSERPSWKQWLAIVVIYMGCTWLAFSAPNAKLGTDFMGIIAAVISGVVFACEGIIAQSCFNKVSPITFTGMVFTVEWIALLVVALPTIHININGGLLLMGGLLSLATLSGYLFNNSGIKVIGAAATAIIGASGPAVTAILGLFILSDNLQPQQWLAILLVTIGVVFMNLARAQKKAASS
jgi:drug/metabolite transporter (DMT)-like permease